MIHFIYRSEGKDERGVPRILGKWDSNSPRRCVLGLGLGAILLMSFLAGFFAEGTNKPQIMFLSNGFLGALFLYGLLHTVSMRKRIKQLSSADSISSRFGVEAERLTTFAEEQGIKPRYNINGEDFYDLKDFGDAAVLLRASVAPAAQPETLLRPAAGTIAPAENLLRSSAAPQTMPKQTETQILTNGRTDTP